MSMTENELNVRLQCATELAKTLIEQGQALPIPHLTLSNVAKIAVEMVDKMVEELKKKEQ